MAPVVPPAPTPMNMNEWKKERNLLELTQWRTSVVEENEMNARQTNE